MTLEERVARLERLATASTEEMLRVFRERDDMIIGFTAAILDLCRVNFHVGADTKAEVLERLRVQLEYVNAKTHGVHGKMLQSLIDTLEGDYLDAAKWMREPPAGSA